MSAGHHRGGKTGGLIWIPNPPKPSSLRRLERSAEWGLIFDLGTLAAECWLGRSKGEDIDQPITMLLALTRWYCSIELPDDPLTIVDGPPLLERRQ